jgi:hypothetical protein
MRLYCSMLSRLGGHLTVGHRDIVLPRVKTLLAAIGTWEDATFFARHEDAAFFAAMHAVRVFVFVCLDVRCSQSIYPSIDSNASNAC